MILLFFISIVFRQQDISLTSQAQGIAVDGDWAIFRLFDKAVSDSSLSGKLRLVFNIEGRKAIFELRSSSVLNPFKLKELGDFQCPGRG